MSREGILSKLRSAHLSGGKIERPDLVPSEIYRDYPRSDLVSVFKERFESLSGEFLSGGNLVDIKTLFITLLSKVSPASVIISGDVDWAGFIDEELISNATIVSPSGSTISSQSMDSYEVGITSCDALIARSGSIVLRASRSGGRRVSILPPHHIVFATENQIVRDLSDWIGTLEGKVDWSMATVISGPSRTADIEKILVHGVHGPRKLTVVLLRNGDST